MYLNRKYFLIFLKVFQHKIQNSILYLKYLFKIHVFEILPIPACNKHSNLCETVVQGEYC